MEEVKTRPKDIAELCREQREATEPLQQMHGISGSVDPPKSKARTRFGSGKSLQKVTGASQSPPACISDFKRTQDRQKRTVYLAVEKEVRLLKIEEENLYNMVVEKGFPYELYFIARADLVKKIKRYQSSMSMMALRGFAESLDRLGLKDEVTPCGKDCSRSDVVR